MKSNIKSLKYLSREHRTTELQTTSCDLNFSGEATSATPSGEATSATSSAAERQHDTGARLQPSFDFSSQCIYGFG